MNMHLLIEFSPSIWYPHFRNIKKLLRKNNIPFKTKKRVIELDLLQSIWVEEDHIKKAQELLSTYEITDPNSIAQEARVEKIAQEFEKNWYLYLIAIFIHYPAVYPWRFLVAIIAILAVIFAPLASYEIFK
jgi:hypothetical protein